MLGLENIKHLLKTSPDANIVLHPDQPYFTIAWANPSYCLLAKNKLDDIIGKSIFEVLNGSSQVEYSKEEATLQHTLLNALHQKNADQANNQSYIKPPAENEKPQEVWNFNAYPVLDEHDKVLFIVLKIADIKTKLVETAIIQSQQELQQQRAQLLANHNKIANILESITDGFYAVDCDWKVTYWNKEAERILQMPREAIIGKILWDAYPLNTHAILFSAYQNAIAENISLHMEMHYAPMNSWMEISAFPSEEGLSVYFKDITSRKHIESKLNEAKQQYQKLFDLSPLPQWVYDLEDYSFKDVNQAAIAQYGYSKEEFLSMTIRDIRPREDVTQFEKLLKKNIKKGVYFKGVVRHVKKTGEIMDVQVEGNSIVFEGKNARLVHALDITEKLKAENSLLASEQQFKALVQDGSDILAILDKAGNYLYLNQTSARNLNMAPEAFIGKNAFDAVHQEDKHRVFSQFKSLTSRHSISISPYRYKDGEGKFRWIETIITDMTKDPCVNGIVANSRDVTQRIEQEIKTKESIERYNIVAKATSDAIWDLDLLQGVVVFNKAITKLFGYKEAFSTLDWWQDRIHPDDLELLKTKVDSLIKNKKSRLYVEYRFRCADGSYKTVLDRSFLLYNQEGKLIRMIGSMQDISERVQYLQTVEAQNQRLKEIAWTQSHVVRAPLARIMGIADLLNHKGMNDPSNVELLPHLSRSASELDAIIREIIRKTEIINENDLDFIDRVVPNQS